MAEKNALSFFLNIAQSPAKFRQSVGDHDLLRGVSVPTLRGARFVNLVLCFDPEGDHDLLRVVRVPNLRGATIC